MRTEHVSWPSGAPPARGPSLAPPHPGPGAPEPACLPCSLQRETPGTRSSQAGYLGGKKAERQRIDAFEPWSWRRLLRVPWTARRSNQSILKKISPGCSLEGLMLKLKCQYFGHLM